MPKAKVLVIVGPTASGKSALAVKLAKKFNGEIISADSRQVYKSLNVGTGKVTKNEMGGIPHHMLDVSNPKNQFTASQYKTLAKNELEHIVTKNKLPIVVGGTGFYIDALTGVANFPEVPPDKQLRKKLSKISASELFKILRKRDPRRAQTIDHNNKVRLVRALEIIQTLGHVPTRQPARSTPYKFVFIGLRPGNIDRMIRRRLLERLEPMISEARRLHKHGLTYKRMHELGLEYRYLALYLGKKISKQELVERLYLEIKHYAKRQMTWFGRNKNIKWFKPNQYREIEKFLVGPSGIQK